MVGSKLDIIGLICSLFHRRFFKDPPTGQSVLIIQCDDGYEKANLIACARHLCEESRNIHLLDLSPGSGDYDIQCSTVHIVFVVQLKRAAGGCKQLGGFHGGNWLSVHIDELRPPTEELPLLTPYAKEPVSSLFDIKPQASHTQMALSVGFLKRCVQPAVAKLNQKEGGSNSQRVITRIKVILQLLSESDFHSKGSTGLFKFCQPRVISRQYFTYLLDNILTPKTRYSR